MNKQLSEKFSSKLKKVSISGVDEFAWEYETILKFLNDSESDSFAILGGDVLIYNSKEEMIYTYDNWGVDSRFIGESFQDFCKRGKQITIDYLKKYPVKKENLFILVLTSEATTGM